MKRKGFTLVELLAVIVILAVIAMIAVPQIISIIENSRKDTFKESVRSAFKAVELAHMKAVSSGTDFESINAKALEMDNNPFESGEFTLDGDAITISTQLCGIKYCVNSEITTLEGLNSGKKANGEAISGDVIVNTL